MNKPRGIIVRGLLAGMLLVMTGVCSLPSIASSEPLRLHILTGVRGLDQYQSCIIKAIVSQEKLHDRWQITIHDTQSDEIMVAKIGRELRQRKDVDMIYGNLTSQGGILIADVFAGTNTPILVATASNPKVTDGHPNVARYIPDSKYYSDLYFRMATRHLKQKKIAVVANLSKTFSAYYAGQFTEKSKQHGLAHKEFSFLTGVDRFKEMAEEIVKDNYDGIYAPIYQASILRFTAALKAAGYRGNFISHDSGLGGYIVNLDFPIYVNAGLNPQAPASDQAYYAKLNKQYCADHKINDVSFTGAASIDAMLMLKSIIEKEPKIRGLALAKKLQEHNFEGITGQRIFRNGRIEAPAYFVKIFKGETTFFRKIE